MKTDADKLAEALRAFGRAFERAGTWYGDDGLMAADLAAREALAEYDGKRAEHRERMERMAGR